MGRAHNKGKGANALAAARRGEGAATQTPGLTEEEIAVVHAVREPGALDDAICRYASALCLQRHRERHGGEPAEYDPLPGPTADALAKLGVTDAQRAFIAAHPRTLMKLSRASYDHRDAKAKLANKTLKYRELTELRAWVGWLEELDSMDALGLAPTPQDRIGPGVPWASPSPGAGIYDAYRRWVRGEHVPRTKDAD